MCRLRLDVATPAGRPFLLAGNDLFNELPANQAAGQQHLQGSNSAQAKQAGNSTLGNHPINHVNQTMFCCSPAAELAWLMLSQRETEKSDLVMIVVKVLLDHPVT